MERATRIELARPAWEADILPLNYARISCCIFTLILLHTFGFVNTNSALSRYIPTNRHTCCFSVRLRRGADAAFYYIIKMLFANRLRRGADASLPGRTTHALPLFPSANERFTRNTVHPPPRPTLTAQAHRAFCILWA